MVSCHFNAQKPVDRPEVHQHVEVVQLLLEVFDKLWRAAGNDAVIHIGCEYEDVLPLTGHKDPRIFTMEMETDVSEYTCEGIVPLEPGLLEPIDCLLETFD